MLAVIHRRHPDAVGQRQALLALVAHDVEAGAQFEAGHVHQFGTRVQLVRSPFFCDIDLGLVGQGAERCDQRILLVGAALLGDEAHRLAGAVSLRRERAAEQVVVAVVQRVLAEVVEFGCALERTAGDRGVGDAGGAVAFEVDVAALAVQVELAGLRFDALIVAGAEIAGPA